MNRDRFYAAWTFDQMVAAAAQSVDLWKSIRARAKVDPEAVRRVEAIEGEWHLLVLSEDWCGDAVNTVPVIDELAARTRNLDLRILSRDGNPDLMDAHLTNGRSRSIPVVIVYDADFVERAWWGPRPAELQRWMLGEGQAMEKDARYRESRRWYTHDHGRSTIAEIVGLLERAGAGGQRPAGASASSADA